VPRRSPETDRGASVADLRSPPGLRCLGSRQRHTACRRRFRTSSGTTRDCSHRGSQGSVQSGDIAASPPLPVGPVGAGPASRLDLKSIRVWAQASGISVSERGRVSARWLTSTSQLATEGPARTGVTSGSPVASHRHTPRSIDLRTCSNYAHRIIVRSHGRTSMLSRRCAHAGYGRLQRRNLGSTPRRGAV
jgi:hypothetical protein